MRILNDRLCRIAMTGGLTAALFGFAPWAIAQQTGARDQDQDRASVQARENANGTDDDARFNQFLEDHKDVAKHLRNKPELANDKNYLNHHKDLREFMDTHPRLRESMASNPRDVMQREDNFVASRIGTGTNARGNADTQANAGTQQRSVSGQANSTAQGTVTTQRNATAQGSANTEAAGNAEAENGNPNRDITGRELVETDRFLDSHPDIAKDLQNKPSLINDATYVKDHPALGQFLSQHPGVREEITETPSYFIYRADRIGAGNGGQARNPNPDITRRELAATDQFLDSHPAIDKDLQGNPRLANDQTYLQNHPQLQTFLSQHPGVQSEISETPNYFIYRTDRYESQERLHGQGNGQFDTGANATDRDRGQFDANTNDRDRGRSEANRDEELGRMEQFLDDHPKMAKQIADNPGLLNEKGYLKHHQDLRGFLEQHPGVREAVQRDPSRFQQREQARLQQLNMQPQQPKTKQPKSQVPTTTPNLTPNTPPQTLRPVGPGPRL